MDIQSRKLEFIQDFLKLQNEETLVQLEKLLKKIQKIEKEHNKSKEKEFLKSFGVFASEKASEEIKESRKFRKKT